MRLGFTSFLAFYKAKDAREIELDGVEYGSHKLVPLKIRSWGFRGLQYEHPLRRETPDGVIYQKNHINLERGVFTLESRGTLRSTVDRLDIQNNNSQPDTPAEEEANSLMDDIKQILLNLGFSNISDLGKEYRARPIYRDSDNSTVLSVKKDTGYFVDYARGLSGPLEKLVELCLGCSSSEAKKWLESDQGFIVKKRHVYDIPAKKYKTLSQNAFDDVIRDNSYWLNRGIDEETISVFEGGVF